MTRVLHFPRNKYKSQIVNENGEVWYKHFQERKILKSKRLKAHEENMEERQEKQRSKINMKERLEETTRDEDGSKE